MEYDLADDEIFEIERTPNLRVYCQACGNELTGLGGVVSASGNLYCCDNFFNMNGAHACFDKEIVDIIERRAPKKAMGFHYFEPKQVQEKVREGVLVNFGPLERKV
ncbi:MAG: hypothetical protein ABIH63_02160 [archaeon]